MRRTRLGDVNELMNRVAGEVSDAPRPVNRFGLVAVVFGCLWTLGPAALGAERAPAAARFEKEIQPILKEYCYDCHGDGLNKGKVAFDSFTSDADLLGRRDLWWAVLKNLRAGLMPPEKKPRPSPEQQKSLVDWIKQGPFEIDAASPDPGRVTLRRLNRVEYRNSIRDLTGFDFKVEEELPPDDTGYGFDNIGDVLTVSPMLLEKYMQAAEVILAEAVPRVPRVVNERNLPGRSFYPATGPRPERPVERYSFYEPAKLAQTLPLEHAGSYRFILEFEVNGEFEFDPGRCQVRFALNDQERFAHEFVWKNNERFSFDFTEKMTPGEHRLAFDLQPLVPIEEKKNTLYLRFLSVKVQGPQEKEHWVRPRHWDLFFTKDPPATAAERAADSRDILRRFVERAYRRPVDEATVTRLAAIAAGIYTQPEKRFEDGIAQALIPVLASPRFLFRIEESVGPAAAAAPLASTGRTPHAAVSNSRLVDEYSLASRLSYFLWSTMPDAELMRLAQRGELRQNLPAQLQRMLSHDNARALVENFVGQWLQVRDVEGIDINARAVLARDAGEERELERRRRQFRDERDREGRRNEPLTPEQRAEREKERERRRQFFRPRFELDRDLRRAMRQETEMAFRRVLKEDRSVLELLDSRYTYLNEKLANHYGLTNLAQPILGPDMRLVDLPEDHPRGGILTHGTVLVVTSNPTRTSPVKRGLFLLENILGLPPPPPPADIPQLEESEKAFRGRTNEPTLREVLAVHREQALCSSCHNRMDPLGLALENFNALGMWREKERGQPIDPAGRLITGEPFRNIRELKRVLTTSHRTDFYRCLSEKLLVYALGRGLEHYDVETVDRIVDRLERENGRFSVLLAGVIDSAPFQKRREHRETTPETKSADAARETNANAKAAPRAELKQP